MIYLLSYPRSGNSFIRYAVEYVSKNPTYDYGKSINEQYDTNIEYNDTTYILRKEHFVVDIPDAPEKIILLVRDFKDVFISHHFRDDVLDNEKIMESFMMSINEFWKDYYELLYLYDISPTNKLLVYYDDINEKSLIDIFKFLNLENYQEFIDNYDYHQEYFLEKYKDKEGSKSEGFTNLWQIYTSSQLTEINELFRKGNPELFDKYLKRFA